MTNSLRAKFDTAMVWTWYTMLVLLPGVGGAGLLCWQAFRYLQSGEWVAVSVIDFLLWSGLAGSWGSAPSTWLGAWKLLNWLPASLTGMVVAIGMMWLSMIVID